MIPMCSAPAICVASAVRPPTRTVRVIAIAANGAKYTSTVCPGMSARPAAVIARSERITRIIFRSSSHASVAKRSMNRASTPAMRPAQMSRPMAPRQSTPSFASPSARSFSTCSWLTTSPSRTTTSPTATCTWTGTTASRASFCARLVAVWSGATFAWRFCRRSSAPTRFCRSVHGAGMALSASAFTASSCSARIPCP